MDADACRALVRRFYDELWNERRMEALDELVADDVRFRGSLGTSIEGREELRGYVLGMREALPDFSVTVEQLVAETGAASARLTFRGTHTGQLMGVQGTGRAITWAAAGFFRIADGRITEAWVLGDLSALHHQIAGPEAGSPS